VLNREAIEKLEEMAQAIAAPNVPPASTATGPEPYILVPDGYKAERLGVDMQPHWIGQRVALHDAKSFIDYVARFATESTAIFFNEEPREFTAILDYHNKPEEPRWCDHRATFAAQVTPEWATWFGSNKKVFSQVDFATFLEDNLIDVVDPAGADLLEITRTLEAKKDVSYSSAIRLGNGSVRINYDEQIKGSANTQAGNIEIPEQFTLQLQVIKGGSTFQFPARFKYRLKDRALVLWYEIIRSHKIVEQALNEAVAFIQESAKVTIRKGAPALPK